MARKDIFSSVMGTSAAKAPDVAPMLIGRSASRSIMQSFEDLSKMAVVELAPELVDGSFVVDRLDGNDEEYGSLLDSIRANGQDTPILVRPHPTSPGRYQAVFGHRRLKAAKDLGRHVRAIVRDMPDREHVIAQGQENAARSNLSFIERTIFARQLIEQGHSTETLMAALVLDETTLSKMRSVLASLPVELIEKIGAAKSVGRDRWWQFSKLYERLSAAEQRSLIEVVNPTEPSEARFDVVHALASRRGTSANTSKKQPLSKRTWAADDKSVSVTLRSDKKQAVVTLRAKDGARFAEFVADQLERLYDEFRRSETRSTGD